MVHAGLVNNSVGLLPNPFLTFEILQVIPFDTDKSQRVVSLLKLQLLA